MQALRQASPQQALYCSRSAIQQPVHQQYDSLHASSMTACRASSLHCQLHHRPAVPQVSTHQTTCTARQQYNMQAAAAQGPHAMLKLALPQACTLCHVTVTCDNRPEVQLASSTYATAVAVRLAHAHAPLLAVKHIRLVLPSLSCQTWTGMSCRSTCQFHRCLVCCCQRS